MPDHFVPLTPLDHELTEIFHASLTEQGRPELCKVMGVKFADADGNGNIALAIFGAGEGGYPSEAEPIVSKAMHAVMAHLIETFHLPAEGKAMVRGPRSWEDNDPVDAALLERFKQAMGVQRVEDGEEPPAGAWRPFG